MPLTTTPYVWLPVDDSGLSTHRGSFFSQISFRDNLLGLVGPIDLVERLEKCLCAPRWQWRCSYALIIKRGSELQNLTPALYSLLLAAPGASWAHAHSTALRIAAFEWGRLKRILLSA